MSNPVALLNGRPVDGLPLSDRGLAYGDGLFETITVRGRPLFLQRHLQRLEQDSARLDIVIDGAAVRAEIDALLRAGHTSGVLKVIVTRAAMARGYQPGRGTAGNRLLLFYPQVFSGAMPTGLRVRVCRQRLAEQPALAGIKHLNRLEQVLARAEWSDPAIAEGLLLDQRGRVVEATASNIFLVRDGRLLTPRLHRCGVAGILRAIVLERLAPARVIEADLTLDDVIAAEEVFLTNSVNGISPVVQIECLQKPRGDVTIGLQHALQQLVDDEIR